MAFEPKERAQAKALGHVMYFTGRPCNKGHIAFRLVSNGICNECSKEIQKRAVEKRLLNNPNWYKENYAKNPEKYRKTASKYRQNNPDKVKESLLKSVAKNKPKKAALERARQARKLNATPPWLTKKDFKKMELFYIESKKTTELSGFNCHVDHIIPLQGKNVCGLHVPWNLRIVSQSYNSKKNNKLDECVLFVPSTEDGVLVHSSALPWNWSK